MLKEQLEEIKPHWDALRDVLAKYNLKDISRRLYEMSEKAKEIADVQKEHYLNEERKGIEYNQREEYYHDCFETLDDCATYLCGLSSDFGDLHDELGELGEFPDWAILETNALDLIFEHDCPGLAIRALSSQMYRYNEAKFKKYNQNIIEESKRILEESKK